MAERRTEDCADHFGKNGTMLCREPAIFGTNQRRFLSMAEGVNHAGAS